MSFVTFQVQRGDKTGARGQVLIRPVGTPVLVDVTMLSGSGIPLQPDVDGKVTVELHAGVYLALLPDTAYPVEFGVPGDNETYLLASLIRSPVRMTGPVAPAITVALWSEHELEKMVRGGAFSLDDESISGLNASCPVTWPAPPGFSFTGTYTITGWSEEQDRETAFTVTHDQARKRISVAARTLNDDGKFTTPMIVTITDIPEV
jgi:hypothetical protein